MVVNSATFAFWTRVSEKPQKSPWNLGLKCQVHVEIESLTLPWSWHVCWLAVYNARAFNGLKGWTCSIYLTIYSGFKQWMPAQGIHILIETYWLSLSEINSKTEIFKFCTINSSFWGTDKLVLFLVLLNPSLCADVWVRACFSNEANSKNTKRNFWCEMN